MNGVFVAHSDCHQRCMQGGQHAREAQDLSPSLQHAGRVIFCCLVQVVGLATVSIACCRASDANKTKKWAFVVGAPTVLTALVYAVIDRSKFQGYSSAEHPPLSHWGGGGRFGVMFDFSGLFAAPCLQGVYIVRVFISITLNVCNILLVLIDAVCLEVGKKGGCDIVFTYCPSIYLFQTPTTLK